MHNNLETYGKIERIVVVFFVNSSEQHLEGWINRLNKVSEVAPLVPCTAFLQSTIPSPEPRNVQGLSLGFANFPLIRDC